jgi:GlpG protein
MIDPRHTGDYAGYGYLPLTEIWSGGYSALFTAVFVHGNPYSWISTLLHIGFNLLWLYALGMILEETIHPLAWALFFISSAVVASGAEIALSGNAAIGASGVVYAMFGLMWAGRQRYPHWQEAATRQNLNVFVGWGLFCVAATWLNILHVANAAHFGGLLFGLAVGWLFLARRHRVVSVLILVGLLTLTVLSVTWMPWSLTWTEWKGGEAAREMQYDSAIFWYRRSLELGAKPAVIWQRIMLLEAQRNNPEGAQSAQREWLRAMGYDPDLQLPKQTPPYYLPPASEGGAGIRPPTARPPEREERSPRPYFENLP